MQQVSQQQSQYAGLGLRVAATIIDTAVLFLLLVVLIGVSAGAGYLTLPDPATTEPFDVEATQATLPTWLYVATYGLVFIYYALLESLTGASLGKLVLGLRVRMDDGRPATSVAVVVRNLIRVPEALFWYIPSGISCAASSQRKRLGDFAAGTVVVKHARQSSPASSSPGGFPAPSPGAASPLSTLNKIPDAPSPALGQAPDVPTPTIDDALTRLKASVLAVRGAHDSYLRFSERELARASTDGDAATNAESSYSPEYVAAWYTLAESVEALAEARRAADRAALERGVSLENALAAMPDLALLLRQLAPYVATDAHDRLYEAYVAVVRAETRPERETR
ncbi:MAG: RDD family protein [Thermoleophilia bacterium]